MKTVFKFLAIAFTGLVIFSCEHKTDCIAVIQCHDEMGRPVIGANVELFAMVKTPDHGLLKADLRASGVTDDAGTVSFFFKLPAVYDVAVNKESKTGKGIVKLEEGKSVSEEVILK
jgi:hypothetical protein